MKKQNEQWTEEKGSFDRKHINLKGSDERLKHCRNCEKLQAFDWLENITQIVGLSQYKYVEIRFKHNRKDFYVLPENIEVTKGDIVAVEATPGHDIGIVSLTGAIVVRQMRQKNYAVKKEDIKKVYRKAKPNDIEKWLDAISYEEETLYKSRQHAKKLNLLMKINDVEYQGDKTKAVFSYTAEDRVDFRKLIKNLADEFNVRIEMKQIGVRQEAGKIGGIGSCGRELCCGSWITNFKSVSTNSARTQQLSLNPQKLTGQCGKLKCCMNYEYPVYHEALEEFPSKKIVLHTKKGKAFHQKTDVFSKTLWYTYENEPANLIPLSLVEVKSIIALNKKKKMPEALNKKEDTPKNNQNQTNNDYNI